MKKIYNVDVAVFGAGPAGLAAAYQAGKDGKSVLLVEITDKIGGVMASCPGMMLGAGYPLGHNIGGFFEEFVTRMYNQNPPVAERRVCSLENFGDEVVYYPEYAVEVLHNMLNESKVKLLINTIANNVVVCDNKIEKIECITGSQNIEINAKVYMDCTGNGDIGYKAGIKSEKGNKDGLMMGGSLTFFMENVDWDKVFSNNEDPYFEEYAKKGIAEGRIHKTIPQIYMLKGFRPGTVFFNTVTVTDLDGTDPESVEIATSKGRTRALQLAKFMQEEVPGFENSFVSHVGPTIGIRETRRLEGMYKLEYEDIYDAKKFEDGIVACNNPLDEVFRDENTTHYSHEAALDEGYYTIPLSALIPKEIKNLMFAGRCMSVDLKGFASVRGMPQCMLMGQSIAVAANQVIEKNIDVQNIDRKEVVNEMKKLGVWGI